MRVYTLHNRDRNISLHFAPLGDGYVHVYDDCDLWGSWCVTLEQAREFWRAELKRGYCRVT